ncbi:hypothetical protein [Komagataeibacter nataicola]|uniref:hypothetical protein n=1 Tax=Komagataeibacter nataicola TaxID=265960 RepID=UPI001428A396|nr:hypothetical protein [Komagataeibacter nataicola]
MIDEQVWRYRADKPGISDCVSSHSISWMSDFLERLRLNDDKSAAWRMRRNLKIIPS